MRIVGGMWRGRVIKAPEGEDTRPTIDRVREAVASAAYSALGGFDGVRVLDAFGGSGAMGFEMMSRGAEHLVVFDSDPKAIRCIRSNAESLGLGREQAGIVRGDVFASAKRGRILGGPFGLVILDPPYAVEVDAVCALLSDLARRGSLTEDALVIYEHSGGRVKKRIMTAPMAHPEGYTFMGRKTYGAVCIDQFRLGVHESPAATEDADENDEAATVDEMASVDEMTSVDEMVDIEAGAEAMEDDDMADVEADEACDGGACDGE